MSSTGDLWFQADEQEMPIRFTLGTDIELKYYDLEVTDEGEMMWINLAPPDFEPATLSGSEPESYVELARRIVRYALSDDAGDWQEEEDRERVRLWMDEIPAPWVFEGRE